LDTRQIERVIGRLGEVVLDPVLWPEILEEICRGVGATGAILLQSDVRTPDVPRTAGVDDLFKQYFANSWHNRDLRARAVPALLHGRRVVTDEDCVTADEMRREPFYNELHIPLGFQWFAGIGFRAASTLWGLCIQRTIGEGPFTQQDKRLLAELSPHLTEAATLSTAVGRRSIADITNALGLVQQPAVALDQLGYVLEINAAAHALFGDDVRVSGRRLVIRDRAAAAALADLLDQMRATQDIANLSATPIVVRRNEERPLLIRILPVSGPARGPFVGARVLLLLTNLRPRSDVDSGVLAQAFALTPAEAALLRLVGAGENLRNAADQLGITYETARSRLKLIFAKTDLHRQAELVALMARMPW
jgi:DNA-binding CsgD family transcriptional regulator